MSAAEHATNHWGHKDLWRKHGKDFLVEVSRHSASPSSLDIDGGPHRWCVYAYIYPKHPHFSAFDTTTKATLFQEAATVLPLHGYPSLCEYPMYDGKVTSVKVGADYHHLHDAEFTRMATPEEAEEVFADAQRLFDWLQARAAIQKATAGENE
jgi:hypothetical protein